MEVNLDCMDDLNQLDFGILKISKSLANIFFLGFHEHVLSYIVVARMELVVIVGRLRNFGRF